MIVAHKVTNIDSDRSKLARIRPPRDFVSGENELNLLVLFVMATNAHVPNLVDASAYPQKRASTALFLIATSNTLRSHFSYQFRPKFLLFELRGFRIELGYYRIHQDIEKRGSMDRGPPVQPDGNRTMSVQVCWITKWRNAICRRKVLFWGRCSLGTSNWQ